MTNEAAIVNYMKIILGTEVSEDIVTYISSIKQEEDYDEFMENILDKNNSKHMHSYEAIRDIIFKRRKENKQQRKLLAKNLQDNYQIPNNKVLSSDNASQNKKGKSKFRDINTYQAKKKQKEGRCACDCLGQEHDFMNNCMRCGRIHCMEEGPGPCLFCGNMITVAGDFIFDNNNKKTKSVMKPRENKVFDDDNDYFKINSKRKSGKDGREKMVVALDFATRKVIESTKEDAKIRERLLKDSVEHLKKVQEIYKNIQRQSEQSGSIQQSINQNINEDLVNLLIQMRHKKPVGKEDLGPDDNAMPIINYTFGNKVFDEELMMNTDHGLCLSMHQPWASLLVAGVKKHEGRTWPTTHRGRLWIAAAAKVPEEEEIEVLESFYRDYYQDNTLRFPKEYPTSCLLGCVTVDDCLGQEEFRKKYRNGESESPYVLICSNPIILPIFYPIVGKHKIYPLEKDLHKCAKIALQHAKYVE